MATKTKTYAEQLYAHGRKSESYSAIKNMIALASTQPDIWIDAEQLDTNQWLFNCANGVIDLTTGELLRHDRKYLCTMMSEVPYDPSALCPRWDMFLYEIFNGDEDLIDFVQKAIGYSLTGCVREEVFFFLHGSGRNGKSTVMNVMQALLGEYARMTSAETLMQKSEDGIGNDVAKLKGARLIVSPEVEQGKSLNESKLKDLTSTSKIQARFLFGEFFEFTPTGKIWMYGNHEPNVKGIDDGIWRRMVPIPFEVTIDPSKTDTKLIDKLVSELPGILAWAVRGCLEWQRAGLVKPTAITDKADEYRQSLDVIGSFLAEVLEPMPTATMPARRLYESYTEWARITNNRPLSEQAFGRQMAGRKDVKSARRATGKVFLDVSIRVDLSRRYDLYES